MRMRQGGGGGEMWYILILIVSVMIITSQKIIHKMQASEPPAPIPRKKQPNDALLRSLKTELQTLPIPPRHAVHYNLSTKESKSGFFSNDRLIILNTKQKYIGYISKTPEYLIPFYKEEEVNSLKFKSRVSREEIISGRVKEFKCQPLHGKVGTLQVVYVKGSRNQAQQWVMELKTPKLMHNWVELINNSLLQDEVVVPQPQPEPQKVEIVEQPMPTIVQQPIQPQQPQYKSRFQSNKALDSNVQAINAMYNPQDYLPYQQPYQKNNKNNNNNSLNPASNINNSAIRISNISQLQPSPHSSRIASMPYNDHVTELQYLRKNKPEIFNTDNQLSQKKFNPVHQEGLDNYQHSANYQGGASVIKHSKRGYNEEPVEDPYNARRESVSNNHFQKSGQNNPPYEDPGYYRQRQDSNKQMSNSYVVNILNDPSRSTTNHRKSNNNLPLQTLHPDEYKPYNYDQDNPPYQQPPYQQPQVWITKPQINKTSSKIIEAEMSQASSKANIIIDNKNNRIGNVALDDFGGEEPRPEASMVRSNYLSKESYGQSGRSHGSRRGLSRRKWNEVFAETGNKLQIYEEFVHTCYNIVRDIVNELSLDSNRKDYLPIEVKSPYYTYYNEGILLTMHRFDKDKQENVSSISNGPLLFDQSSYELLKREFYHYNLLLSVTANEGFIKVPLCAYFEYKGILTICKAEVPETFSEVTPKRYEQQFQILQEQIHLRFMFGSFNSYLHPNGKYIILDNMRELIPELPLNSKDGHFFRKEFLLGYDKMIEDINDVHEAHDNLTNRAVPELLGRLESIETYVVNQLDMLRLFHEDGLSYAYLSKLVQTTTSPFLKKLLLTQIVSIIFTSIFRSEIHNLHSSFSISRQFQRLTLQEINQRLLESTYILMDMLFSYNDQSSQQLWKIIVEQCKLKYRIIVSKEDLVPGYLLSSVIERIGINCNFRQSSFNKHEIDFFTKEGNIPRDLIQSFRIKVRRYDLAAISPLVQDIQQIVSSVPTPENFKTLVEVLGLKKEPIPNYLQPLEEQILTYLCHFVPYSEHEEFQHIGIYNMVLLEPHSYHSTKCSLLAIKWCIKKKYIEEALKIYQMKEIENAFWQGEYNPAISQFYDFFSMYYASVGQYDHSIQLARLSLKNIMNVSGTNALPVADKHYQLGNIYFKMGRKEESLKEYTRTKDILKAHQQTQISEYAVILLKLSVLYLNFGKVFEAVNHSLQALKIYDSTQSSEQDQIGTFEILSRCYQITKKQEQLEQICDLASQKFNQTEDYLIFTRMVKLVLYVKLKKLSTPEAKAFLGIAAKLEEQTSNFSQMEAFSFLNRKCQGELLMRKVQNYLQNIVYMYEQTSRRDLFRRYKSLDSSTRNEVEEMLVTLQAMGILIGFGFIMGSLRESYD